MCGLQFFHRRNSVAGTLLGQRGTGCASARKPAPWMVRFRFQSAGNLDMFADTLLN